jgi:hypothetical protein
MLIPVCTKIKTRMYFNILDMSVIAFISFSNEKHSRDVCSNDTAVVVFGKTISMLSEGHVISCCTTVYIVVAVKLRLH